MNRRTALATGAAGGVAACSRKPSVKKTPPPPVAQKGPKRIEQPGRGRGDDHAWMKDDNWQKELRGPTPTPGHGKDHLTAENAYTKAMLADTEALQAQLFKEMKGRIKEDDASVPAPDGPWEYYSRFEVGAQQPKFVRRPRSTQVGGGGAEQLMVDVDALAKGKAFFEVAGAEHSADHALFAYSADEQGSEVSRVYVKALASGKLLAEPVESCTGDFAWSPDSKHLFWIFRDEHGRPTKVFRR